MTPDRFSPVLCVVLLFLTGCGAPPGLDAGRRIPPSNQPIELLPLNSLLVDANSGILNDATAAALAARAARLRARAAAN